MNIFNLGFFALHLEILENKLKHQLFAQFTPTHMTPNPCTTASFLFKTHVFSQHSHNESSLRRGTGPRALDLRMTSSKCVVNACCAYRLILLRHLMSGTRFQLIFMVPGNPGILRIVILVASVKKCVCSSRDVNNTKSSPCRIATALFHHIPMHTYVEHSCSVIQHLHGLANKLCPTCGCIFADFLVFSCNVFFTGSWNMRT